MVGLPARGKTYIARKLCRYLTWLGIRTQVFNVGNYRRKQFGAVQSHNFFDSSNKAAKEQRTQAAMDALKDMKKWFDEFGINESNESKNVIMHNCNIFICIDQVAIYDATNTTKERRNMIKSFCDDSGIQVLQDYYIYKLILIMIIYQHILGLVH
jgi:6-phosphofructo-2-kinase / fructose-2,6-biphosphatase 2